MKTAIIMTGHVRTWDLIKDEQLSAITDIYGEDVDWFISVWDTTTVTKEYILNYFSNKKINLIKLNWVDRTCYENRPGAPNFNQNSLIYPTQGHAYFSYYIRELSCLDKKKYEFTSETVYERVVFTRPDIIFYYASNLQAKIDEDTFAESYVNSKKDFALQVRGDYDDVSYSSSSPSANDIRTIAGSLSSDLFGMMGIDALSNCVDDYLYRFKLRKSEPHSNLSVFFKKHLITVDHRYTEKSRGLKQFVRSQVVRPSMNIEKIKEEYKNWDLTGWEPGVCPNWPDIKNKLTYCLFRKIDLHDYNLESFEHEIISN